MTKRPTSTAQQQGGVPTRPCFTSSPISLRSGILRMGGHGGRSHAHRAPPLSHLLTQGFTAPSPRPRMHPYPQPPVYDKYRGTLPVPAPPAGVPVAPGLQQQYRSPYLAPGMQGGRLPDGSTPWSTGLCHCCDDPGNCLITCVCPCITFGQIAEIVNMGSMSCAASGAAYALLGMTGLSCLYSCFYRSRMRGQYQLEEAPTHDCLVHFCCECCALCQEYRELRNRGFDMGIGWQANMERQSRVVTIAPIIGGAMIR